ncbi:bifunctional nicotinamide-nucleotide adenylyltransferase/Nudix hydroxylase [Pseudofrancisella aestuarii]|uniref:Bifunctional nicotinamide-nucleotide adenylyltransferase/Nudix hydroxylase n=1 Tax=Pseudofrancisella aestuarii TaxID=2670347 RepID=A0ABV9TAW3_9GAMM|nr:bifunctional nicotinamide-nucleotide adenylyltransferase/Nudix hydroxylase [Pseudofrancisella aestuarii]
MKKYDLSVFIGRFQPFHVGHLHNIKEALVHSNKIIINVGSSFGAPNIKNPFSFEQRKQMIISDLEVANIDISRVNIEHLADYFYQEEKWEQHLRDNVNKYTNLNSTVAIVGHKKDDTSYYLKSFPEWEYISVDNYKNYNATNFRESFYKGYILKDYMVSSFSSVGTYGFLNSFLKTKQYIFLKDEYEYVEAYKKLWSTAPYKPVLVTTDALVIINNNVLLVQRKNHPGKDLWALPGGFLDNDEFIEAGVIRELYEETAIDLTRDQLALARQGTYVFDYPARSVRGRTITHVSLFVFQGLSELPATKAQDDAKALKWVPLDIILNNMCDRMLEDHYQIITVLSEKLSK